MPIDSLKNKEKDNKNHIALKILDKIKTELSKDGIKEELHSSILQPIYSNIIDKVFPHYITLISLLIVIVILLILIIILNIQKSPLIITTQT